MSNLILNSLEIEGYRAYRHLLIPQLGRINLVVGKNNVGKSSLLEALWLYAKRANLTELKKILQARDESPMTFNRPDRPGDKPEDRVRDIKQIFHGRKDVEGEFGWIKIGPVDATDDLLSMTIRWYIRQEEGEDGEYRLVRVNDPATNPDAAVYLESLWGTKGRRIDNLAARVLGQRGVVNPVPGYFIPANGMNNPLINRLWDGIALTEGEDAVIKALQIIAPDVKRISFVGQNDDERWRVPLVKIGDQAEPVYLRSLGEGMSRLLGITLALANSANGMLLIDEVESGLHYSIQPDVWRLIFQTARTLNVQVFATTHSWDCIEAFQKASSEDQAEEAMLIRLENKQGEIIPTLFDERRLSIATREQIEVR